jgi:Enoyl-(Acyl carrier protein) reductase
MAHRVDASKAADVAAMVEACASAYGRIDVLDNNVGIAELGGVVEVSEAAWDKVFAVNLKSAYLTMKHVIPLMDRQGGGSIITSRRLLRSGTPASRTPAIMRRARSSEQACCRRGQVCQQCRDLVFGDWTPERGQAYEPEVPVKVRKWIGPALAAPAMVWSVREMFSLKSNQIKW